MQTQTAYEFACPQCRKRASTANPMYIRYSFRRLELRIFLCSDCRKIYIDEPTIRRIIREWRKDGSFIRKMPLDMLVREFMDDLNESVDTYWTRHLGYKRAKFIKRRIKKTSGS